MKNLTTRACLLFFIFSSSNVVAEQTIPDIFVRNHTKHMTISGGSKNILTQQQFARTGVTTLTDALYSLAGLQLHSSSGTSNSASLSMRGFGANGSSNVLMLINGIPLTNPDLMPPSLNTVPLEDIRQVEITAGSESVLYGDQAVGGIINIITSDTPEQRVRVQCNVGSFDLRECHATLATFYQALNLRFSGMQKVTDNYRDHNVYTNSTIFAVGSYGQGKNKFAVNYKFTYENMQYPGALTAAQVRQDRRQASNNSDFFRNKNQFVHFKYSSPLKENWHTETNAFIRHMDGNGVLSADFEQSRLSLFVRPAIIAEYQKYKWTSGIDAESDKYRLSSPFGSTDNKQEKFGLFTLANVHAYSKTTFTVGARLAQQDTRLRTSLTDNNINRAFASTLGLSYDLQPQTTLYARRTDNFRFPKSEENTAGRTPLRTQRGTSYEVGALYDNDEDSASANLFVLDLCDEIAFDPFQTPTNPFGTNRNLSPTRRYGASVTAKKQVLQHLQLDGQINYVHARFQGGRNSGRRIPLVAETIARSGLSYKVSKNWSAYGEAVFTGNQFPANDDGNVTGGQGGFTTYNLNIRYQYQALSVALRLNNITNKYYYLYTVYSPNTMREFFYPAADRNITLSVHYDFV